MLFVSVFFCKPTSLFQFVFISFLNQHLCFSLFFLKMNLLVSVDLLNNFPNLTFPTGGSNPSKRLASQAHGRDHRPTVQTPLPVDNPSQIRPSQAISSYSVAPSSAGEGAYHVLQLLGPRDGKKLTKYH